MGLHAGGIVHPGRLQRLGRGVECGLQVVRRRPEGLAFLRRLQLSTEIGELVERAVGACVEHLMQLVAGLDARGVRVADRVAVQRDNGEGVSGQGQAAVLSGAAVEHVQQHPLAGLHADRLAVAEHASVDRECVIAHLVAVRHALRE